MKIMKLSRLKYLLVMIVMTFIHTNTSAGSLPTFDYLLGNWQRVNEQQGRETYESWHKISHKEYVGISFTLQGGQKIWQEDVRLIYQNNKWTFNVTMEGESEATTFVLTQITDNSFICENPKNEFPKKIEYKAQSGKLKASVSADDMMLAFEFIQIPPE